MNIVLNPVELLHVYKILLSHPLQDMANNELLIEKFQRSILDCLEKEYDRINDTKYKSWEYSEQKRINELQTSLNDIRVSREKTIKK